MRKIAALLGRKNGRKHKGYTIKKSRFSRIQLLVFIVVFGTFGTFMLLRSGATSPVGDLNNDGTIDIFDLSTLLSNYGKTTPTSDINSDGVVDIFDLSTLLSHYLQNAPVVSFASPANGASVNGTVSISANATDSVGVTRVEFYINNALSQTDTTAPYSFSWNTLGLTNGTYLITAKAYDARGNFAIANMNLVKIDDPINGRWYSTSSVINVPIPASVAIHPDSTSMIQSNPNWIIPSNSSLYNCCKQWLGVRQRWGVSIADASSPQTSITVDYSDNNGMVCSSKIVTVLLPSNMLNAYTSPANTDKAGAIMAPDGTEWDVYKLTPPNVQPWNPSCPPDSHWHAGRVDQQNWITGLGYFGVTASGSHIWTGGGLIRPRDTLTGLTYDHALTFFSYLGCAAGQTHPRAVVPAETGDGVQTGLSCIPAGARVQLDPSIDVTTWPSIVSLSASKKAWMIPLLKTMQTYGMVLQDNTPGPAEGGISADWSALVSPYVYPWEADGTGWGYANGVPFDLMAHFRVIDWTKWTGA
jgi:hypothetical protein